MFWYLAGIDWKRSLCGVHRIEFCSFWRLAGIDLALAFDNFTIVHFATRSIVFANMQAIKTIF